MRCVECGTQGSIHPIPRRAARCWHLFDGTFGQKSGATTSLFMSFSTEDQRTHKPPNLSGNPYLDQNKS